jgi:hypothetical protein
MRFVKYCEHSVHDKNANMHGSRMNVGLARCLVLAWLASCLIVKCVLRSALRCRTVSCYDHCKMPISIDRGGRPTALTFVLLGIVFVLWGANLGITEGANLGITEGANL